MKKNEIIKGVFEAYQTAINLKNQLDSLTKVEIWNKNS